MFRRRSTTRAFAPTWVRCGSRVRVAGQTVAGAADVGGGQQRQGREQDGHPEQVRLAEYHRQTATATAAARKDLPRVVRPRSASRMASASGLGRLRVADRARLPTGARVGGGAGLPVAR